MLLVLLAMEAAGYFSESKPASLAEQRVPRNTEAAGSTGLSVTVLNRR